LREKRPDTTASFSQKRAQFVAIRPTIIEWHSHSEPQAGVVAETGLIEPVAS